MFAKHLPNLTLYKTIRCTDLGRCWPFFRKNLISEWVEIILTGVRKGRGFYVYAVAATLRVVIVALRVVVVA